jgi:4-amino-4-deoxy-L-arabinose transferase-like glycosyltransferase
MGYKYGWLPLLIWIITPTVFWASYNNLLENTLTIFTSLSILFYFESQEGSNYFFLFLSGFMLALGFLTKGFVAFFPWTFPFLLWFFLKKKSFAKVAIDSAMIIFFTIAPLILLILFFPVAKISLHKYIDNQVIESIRNAVTVNSRFDIVIRLFSELAPAAGLCILILGWNRLRKSSVSLVKENNRKALVFILLGLTGVLPVMNKYETERILHNSSLPVFCVGGWGPIVSFN